MGWLPQSVFDDKKKLALALTQEQRDSLTWEHLRKFMVPDTLDMAEYSGIYRRKEGTPWDGVCTLRRIDPYTPAPTIITVEIM